MRSRRATRGFTLVELLVVLGVSTIVLGGLGTLYGFTMRQTGGTLAELAAADQSTTAAKTIEWSVRNAVLCETKTKNGVVALRCTLPSLGVTLNDPQNPASYRGATVDKFGRQRYEAGSRVWFYTSNATGVYGTAGTTLWRAVRSDDADATAADRDLAFTYDYARTATPRFPLVTAFTVSVDATTLLVTFGLSAEGVDYAGHVAAASDAASRRRGVTIARQAFWENWRT